MSGQLVRVGQVWADNDKRSRGREFMVLSVGKTHARVVWAGTRRHTRIRLDRFRPNSTGYRLVHDVGIRMQLIGEERQ